MVKSMISSLTFQLKDILEKIEFFQQRKAKWEVSGPVEADPEYQLIVEANNITMEIDNEISEQIFYLKTTN